MYGGEPGGKRIRGNNIYKKPMRPLLHRLVADHFIINPDPKTKTQVGHNDYVRTNCHWKNLTYQTPSENMKHARARWKNQKPERIKKDSSCPF